MCAGCSTSTRRISITALLERLDYRGAGAVCSTRCGRRTGSGSGFGSVLDLGCGTGLGGAAFRPLLRLAGRRRYFVRHGRAGARQGTLRPPRGRGTDGVPCRRSRARSTISRLRPMFSSIAATSPRSRRRSPACSRRAACSPSRSRPTSRVRGAAAGNPALRPRRRRMCGRHCRAAGLQILQLTEASTRTEKGAPVPGLLVVAQR